MRTIFITIPWFSPAFKAGGPIQSIGNMVAEFTDGVQYKIFCSNADLNNETLVDVETGKWIRYNDCTEVWYSTFDQRKKTLIQQLRIINPDVIFIIGIYDWHFNIVPLIFGNAKRKIVSVRGMLHPGALSVKPIKKKLFLLAWKILRLTKKAWFHVTDTIEEGYTKNVFGRGIRVNIAANFPKKFGFKEIADKRSGVLKMITIALISPMKNHLLVLQALAGCKGEIEYDIFGPVKDPDYWQACVEQIKTLPPNIRVRYRGVIDPRNVADVLRQHQLFILPSKSENFGHAIYEALGIGLPVITSKNTPWNHLDDNHAGLNVELEISHLKAAIETFIEMDDPTFAEFNKGAYRYSASAIDTLKINDQYRKMFIEN